MINLWTGKTIFTFADNSLKDEEAGSGSAADRIIDKRGRSIIEPDPFAPSSEEPTSLPLALGRLHKRLSNPEELKKLHLQHRHMTADQFRFRTRALHLPKSTFDLFDKIRSECEVCQAAKHAPSRSKTSGLRADTFQDGLFSRILQPVAAIQPVPHIQPVPQYSRSPQPVPPTSAERAFEPLLVSKNKFPTSHKTLLPF